MATICIYYYWNCICYQCISSHLFITHLEFTKGISKKKVTLEQKIMSTSTKTETKEATKQDGKGNKETTTSKSTSKKGGPKLIGSILGALLLVAAVALFVISAVLYDDWVWQRYAAIAGGVVAFALG